ncbi:MAG: response regulator, partial [Ketobacter sp.]
MIPNENKSDVVLVVDDSAETLGMLSQVLDEEGLTVLIALDGEQAINIAGKMTPDIVLLDAIMPNIDGFETCRRMKQDANLKNTPIIFMTGLSDTEHIVMGLEAGGVDYIAKPINPQELVARMRVHLSNARMTQSAR